MKEISLWYCLRAVTDNGEIECSSARAKLKALYSRSTFDRAFRLGLVDLWEISVDRKSGSEWIILKSLEKVSLLFGIYRPSFPKKVPLREMSSGRRGAWLYASLLPTTDHGRLKPISRLKIAEATGIDPRRQRRYDKMLGTKRYPNFAVSRFSNEYAAVMDEGKGAPVETRYLGKRGKEGDLRPAWMVVRNGLQEYLKQRRLGNSYVSRAKEGGHSLVRKVRRKLRNLKKDGCLDRLGGLSRHFEKVSALLKANDKGRCHEEPTLRIRARGKAEWELLSLSTGL